jgi:hypothetical protein
MYFNSLRLCLLDNSSIKLCRKNIEIDGRNNQILLEILVKSKNTNFECIIVRDTISPEVSIE